MKEMVPENITISIYDGLGRLPHFNPDLDDDIPLVQKWRSQLYNSDGIIFCTPEYAHGIPGALKNALDWIVSSGELMNKPTAVISASPSPDGGQKANASLVQTLEVMMATLDKDRILSIPTVSAKINKDGQILDQTLDKALDTLIQSLIRSIKVNNT